MVVLLLISILLAVVVRAAASRAESRWYLLSRCGVK
jgi:hypothetical protein